MYEKEARKIVPFSSGYMSLKPNGDGYHKHGRHLSDLRSLLNYVQNTRLEHKFDFSELDSALREKLENIALGIKTVTDKDWRAKV